MYDPDKQWGKCPDLIFKHLGPIKGAIWLMINRYEVRPAAIMEALEQTRLRGLTVRSIGTMVSLPKSTVARHLGDLIRKGWVVVHVDGRANKYEAIFRACPTILPVCPTDGTGESLPVPLTGQVCPTGRGYVAEETGDGKRREGEETTSPSAKHIKDIQALLRRNPDFTDPTTLLSSLIPIPLSTGSTLISINADHLTIEISDGLTTDQLRIPTSYLNQGAI